MNNNNTVSMIRPRYSFESRVLQRALPLHTVMRTVFLFSQDFDAFVDFYIEYFREYIAPKFGTILDVEQDNYVTFLTKVYFDYPIINYTQMSKGKFAQLLYRLGYTETAVKRYLSVQWCLSRLITELKQEFAQIKIMNNDEEIEPRLIKRLTASLMIEYPKIIRALSHKAITHSIKTQQLINIHDKLLLVHKKKVIRALDRATNKKIPIPILEMIHGYERAIEL